MQKTTTHIHVKGKNFEVPSAHVGGRRVIATGRWIKVAKVNEEELVEGAVVDDPPAFVAALKASKLKADVFTFSQKPPATTPQYPYPWEWDNWAVIPTQSFKTWWDALPQEARKNVRRASKRGVVVKAVPLTDNLVKGIKAIYDETPVRQGKAFWHFGKDFETVKQENETYLERSEFIGAYCEEELIGFIKMTYVDNVASLMQILPKNAHYDKRPMNAMLAYTVELCEKKGLSYLVYGQYVYGRKQNSTLTEFKRRNGFEEVKFPRYFVPLTLKGKLVVACGLHRGPSSLIPRPLHEFLLNFRAGFLRLLHRRKEALVQERE